MRFTEDKDYSGAVRRSFRTERTSSIITLLYKSVNVPKNPIYLRSFLSTLINLSISFRSVPRPIVIRKLPSSDFEEIP